MLAYWVEYHESKNDEVKGEQVLAKNKRDAFIKFMDKHEWKVYSSWVSNVTYNNGNVRYFNNFEGHAY